MSSQLRHYHSKRKRGACGYGGCWRLTDGSLCAEHAAFYKQRYSERRAQGLCGCCPQYSGDKSQCDDCRAKARRRHRRLGRAS